MTPLKTIKIEGKVYTIFNNLKEANKVRFYIFKLLKRKGELGLSRKGKRVRVTNVINKEVIMYRSKREAARCLKADPASIYSRNRLFRGIYKIEMLDLNNR